MLSARAERQLALKLVSSSILRHVCMGRKRKTGVQHNLRLMLSNHYFACSPETFCEYLFVVAWESCIEKGRGFLVNFFWSPFPGKQSTKTPQKIRAKFRSLGNGVRKNGVRNRCPYRRCGVNTEIPYRLPFWREFCLFLPVRVAPGVDTEFPYRVRIVDRGVDCRDPVCRHRFRFLENSEQNSGGNSEQNSKTRGTFVLPLL